MKNQALKLISYDHWANEKIIAAMSQVKNLPPRTTELFSHILAVSSIWLSRAKGENETAMLVTTFTKNHKAHDAF
jgi:uncharacterized damage-inducible protein DinB